MVVNPVAGGGRSQSRLPLIERTLSKIGLEADYKRTTRPLEATEIAKQAVLSAKYDAVIAGGGDGTVNEVANGLVGSDVLLGCLPSGTGNDITSSLGIPMDVAPACHLLIHGKRRKIDLGLITGKKRKRYFLGVSGIGYDAEVTKDANDMGKRFMTGTLPYVVSIFRVLQNFSPIMFTIEYGSIKVRFEAMMVSVGNGPMYGGKMLICKNALLDDGLFDVVLVGKLSRFHLIRLFPLLYSCKHLEHHSVEVRRIHQFDISTNRTTLVQADGELIGYLPMRFETIPRAISAITGNSEYFCR